MCHYAIGFMLSAVDLQRWNESYKTAVADLMRLPSVPNNVVTDAVLQLENTAELVTNHSQTISSYVFSVWFNNNHHHNHHHHLLQC